MCFKKKYILLVLFLLFSGSVFLQKDSKEKLIQKKKNIEKEIELANKLLDETRGKKKNSIHELSILKAKIDKRNSLIRSLSDDIKRIDQEILKSNGLLNNYKIELERVKKEYADLIYFAFKNQNNELNFIYLLASEDLNVFYSRLKYLEQYKDYRKDQAKLIIALRKIIEVKIQKLSEQRDIKNKLLYKQTFEKANLVKDSDETDILIKELKKQEKSIADDIEEKKKIYKKLDKEIEDLIKAEAKKTNFTDLSSDLKILAKNFEENKGKLPWPTSQGIIVNKFGDHPHPVIKGVIVSNNGIDISTTANSSVKAIFKGKVSKIFNIKGANNTVIIQHGNYFSVYHNLINIAVKSGQIVNTNDKIGEVFSDPKTGESVVHLEIWKELNKQDPETWLRN